MDIKPALKKQYHAALAMIRQAIERCPDDLWTGGVEPRTFWRIAYHTLFYTHLYLQRQESDFVQWALHREDVASLWEEPSPSTVPYTRSEVFEYCSYCDSIVDECVDKLDLDDARTGFDWYEMPKLEHQLMNIRHIQQHAGQLAERLMALDIDTDWIGTSEGNLSLA